MSVVHLTQRFPLTFIEGETQNLFVLFMSSLKIGVEVLSLPRKGGASWTVHAYKSYWFNWAAGLEMSYHLNVG